MTLGYNLKYPYPKVKIPQDMKSKVCYCRNCNAKNKDSAKICVQCTVTLKEPKMRRKMR